MAADLQSHRPEYLASTGRSLQEIFWMFVASWWMFLHVSSCSGRRLGIIMPAPMPRSSSAGKDGDQPVQIVTRPRAQSMSTSGLQRDPDLLVCVGLDELDVQFALQQLQAFDLQKAKSPSKPAVEKRLWQPHYIVVDEQARAVHVASFQGPELTPEEEGAFRKADGCILLFNCNDRTTFEHVWKVDQEILEARHQEKPALVLVGIKDKKGSDSRVVSKSEGRRRSREIRAPYFEVNRKNANETMHQVYDTAIRMIRDNKVAAEREPLATKVSTTRRSSLAYNTHDCSLM